MRQFTSGKYHHWQGLSLHALLGALAGMLLLHPVTKAIHGAEWPGARSEVERLALAFTRAASSETAERCATGTETASSDSSSISFARASEATSARSST